MNNPDTRSKTLDIKLKFIGAASNVTGSSYLLEANGSRILIDCGLYQERAMVNRNWDPFPVPPESIAAVVLTHAHTDHCGLLPKLVHDGFHGNIYSTLATCELAQIILADSAHIQEEDAEFKKLRHQRENRNGAHPEVPLYTVADAEACTPLFRPVRYNSSIQIADGIRVEFYDAGHVLGASMPKITITTDGERRTIVFSGDVGRWDRPILKDPTLFGDVDYILVESTYGDRAHNVVTSIADSLADVVNSTWEAGGNIVIPSFALQRSQEVLYYFSKLLTENRIPHLMVFLDSPMAVKITEVFKRHSDLLDKEMQALINCKRSPFEFPGLTMVQTVDESKAINHIKGTVVIIAGSGMCTGGRIKHHLVTNISRPESTILFVGYQAVGTLGRQIVDGAEQVRILGQQYPVKARIVRLEGFSSHADREGLLKWLTSLKKTPRRVFVVHGEAEASQSFASFIREKTGWNASVPDYMEEVTLI